MVIAEWIIIFIWSSLISGCIGYLLMENHHKKRQIDELYDLIDNTYHLAQRSDSRIDIIEKKGEVHGSTNDGT